MKHLISLALKYVSRQKQRTLLTFLCVTLSVFILCSFGAYSGSVLQTLKNNEARTGGAWEADISDWVERSDDPEKAMEIAKNHAAVDKYLINISEYGMIQYDRNSSSSMGYFIFSDGKNTKKLKAIGSYSYNGDLDLCGEWNKPHIPYAKEEGWIVPEWFEDMGYSVGDTVNFSLKFEYTEYDEDSEVIKSIRQEIKESKGLPIVGDDPEFSELTGEDREKAEKKNMSYLLDEKGYDFTNYPFKIVDETDEFNYSLKIAGFTDADESLNVFCNGEAEYLFRSLLHNITMTGTSYSTVSVTLNRNLDFDDGLEMLANDLGYDIYSDEIGVNYSLLSYELRSAGGIVNMMDVIIIFSVLLLLFWLLARFVIDNAFEISAKERSTQYAALRIMGASKTQIAAVVLTEAVFYTVTSVPIGASAAYLLCSGSFRSFSHSGFQDFEFRADPYITLLAIALCVIGIFISAYTSSMWATRKLNPIEALNFGKPKSKKSKLRAHRSKLKLSSKRFVSRYTRKNIGRYKSRFLIATITMSIGVTLFAVSLVIISFFTIELTIQRKSETISDYTLNYNSSAYFDEIQETFVDNDLFTRVRISASTSSALKDMDELRETLDKHMAYKYFSVKMDGRVSRGDSNDFLALIAIDRTKFDDTFADVTGMSYDEFVNSGGMLMFSSIYGNESGRQWDEKKREFIQLYEKSYKPLDTPEIISIPIGFAHKGKNIDVSIIGDVCCDMKNEYQALILPLDSEFYRNNNFFTEVRVNVNGSENYEAASAVVKDFTSKYSTIWMMDEYFANTGANDFIGSILKTAAVMVAAVWLVGILSMMNSIITSVLNRSRELMMLRSVGMTKKQLRKTVLQECRLFATVSSVLGSAAAVGIMFLFAKIYGIDGIYLLIGAGVMVIIAAIITAINMGAAALSAIPGVRSLERAEALTKAV